jgi:hypothetical protein
MIALGVVVRHELPDCVLKRCRSEEAHPAQTLLIKTTMATVARGAEVKLSTSS